MIPKGHTIEEQFLPGLKVYNIEAYANAETYSNKREYTYARFNAWEKVLHM